MKKFALEGKKLHLVMFWEVLKVNDYVSKLLFYNNTHRELSHARSTICVSYLTILFPNLFNFTFYNL